MATKIEKGIVTAIVIILVGYGLFIYSTLQKVEKAGGWSKVFIEAGKEIKHIKNEIEKD